MTTTIINQPQPVVLPFSDTELTGAINTLPPTFGRLTASGMFAPDGQTSKIVRVDLAQGYLTALPMASPEGPATWAKRDAESVKFFEVPYVPHMDKILADDIRGLLQIGTNSPRTLASEMNKRLARLRRKFDLTREVMLLGAIKGVVVDGAGIEIYDLFKAFEIVKTRVAFNLSDPATDVRGKCTAVIQQIEDNLSDGTMTGVKAYVSRTFFDLLIGHPKVEKFWLNNEAARELANPTRTAEGTYRPRSFTFGNIEFEEYPSLVTLWGAPGPTRVIADGMAHFFPMGTFDLDHTYVAPPIDVRVLNGSPASTADLVHITTEPMKHGEGVEMKGQMNALPLWRRPALLVEGTAAAV